jgi:hypothetical protein
MAKEAGSTDTCNFEELLDSSLRTENPGQALVKDFEELKRRIARLEEHRLTTSSRIGRIGC